MDGEPVLGEAAARRHLQSSPANFRLQKALSVSLMMQDNFKESVPLLQRLHLEVPGDSDVAVNLAKAHLELKQHDDAEALLADMDGLDAASLLSRSLIERRQLDRASNLLNKALAEFGAHPQLLIDRAAIAIHQGDAAAFDYLDQAEAGLAQMPEAVRAGFRQMILKNRTLTALGLGRLGEARAYTEGLNRADADYMLARIERGEKNYAAAIGHQLQVQAERPDPIQALYLAQLYLSTGDYRSAWPYRQQRRDKPPAPDGLAEWQGEALAGKRILIGVEQGTGDVMQFRRYLSLLSNQGAAIRCPMFEELQPLFEAAFPAIAFGPVAPGDTAYDFHAPLLSIPAILKLDAEAAVLSRDPYLKVPPEATEAWRQMLPEGPTIGIAWKGNPDNVNDRRRSIHDLEPLKNLITAAPATFVSLQWPAEDVEELAPFLQSGRMLDYVHLRSNFADTAALVSALDGVLTVDTSIAHLAGALGKACAVGNPFDADWRWSKLGPAWYGDWLASFEQPAPGDWPSVLEEASGWLADRMILSN